MDSLSHDLNYATLPKVRTVVRWKWIGILQLIQVLPTLIMVTLTSNVFNALLIGLCECVVIGGLQLLFLMPIIEPQLDVSYRKPWKYWLSASVAGLCAGVLISGLIGMAIDMLWVADVLATSGKTMTEEAIKKGAIVAILGLLAGWAMMTPLLMAFMRQRTPAFALHRIASRLFLGTIVEAISSVGVMAMMRNKSDCVCATFSGVTLLLTFAMGFVIFGPGVLLLIVWRRSRQRPMGLCPACAADLNRLGYPARCPVCGIGWKKMAVW